MTCRGCQNTDLVEAVDLGAQHLSDFRDDLDAPPRFPLRLMFCEACKLAQLDTEVGRDLMYHDRYGFKSGVNDTIRQDLKSVVDEVRYLKPHAQAWLDIACNDGTLLGFVPKHLYRFGVDPVAKHTREAYEMLYAGRGYPIPRIVNDYFRPGQFPGVQFDVVTAISVFYDLPDPKQFLRDVKAMLAPDGILCVQQNYLGAMVESNAVDNICHEHLTYFSLTSLQNLLRGTGLEVFRVSTSGVNGGSFRTLIGHTGYRQVEKNVISLRAKEMRTGLDTVGPLVEMGRRANHELRKLNAFLRILRMYGRRVQIYGASTRGAVLWQAAGVDGSLVEAAVERNEFKVGRRFSAVGVPIVSELEMRQNPPDYLLVGPWFFRDEFLERERDYVLAGGRMIFPLPKAEVVDARDLLSYARAA